MNSKGKLLFSYPKVSMSELVSSSVSPGPGEDGGNILIMVRIKSSPHFSVASQQTAGTTLQPDQTDHTWRQYFYLLVDFIFVIPWDAFWSKFIYF